MNRLFPLVGALILSLSLSQAGFAEKSKDGSSFKHKQKKERRWETKDLLSHKAYIKAEFLVKNGQELNLDQELVNKIRDIKTNLKKEALRTRAEIDIVHIEMRNELEKGKTNGIKVPSLIDKEYELKKKIGKEAYNSLTELDKLLSAEQKEQAKMLFQKKFKKSRYSKKKDPLLYQF